MQMHKADGGGIIFWLVVGAIALVQWIVRQRTGGDADAEDDQSLPRPLERPAPPPLPPVPPRHGHDATPSEFQRRREVQPPRHEPTGASHSTSRSRAVQRVQPIAVPPTLTQRAKVAPHQLSQKYDEAYDETAAPLRNAGDSPGSLHTHMDEWMGQDLPEFKTMEVPGRAAPNTLPDAPPPATVAVPVSVAGSARRIVRPVATFAMVASRGRRPYHINLTPHNMRQAIVLTEVLGRPRGYDL